MTAERVGMDEARDRAVPWLRWGPYLSERQWGTVREDYSEGGDAWDCLSHDQARSRDDRRCEGGLASTSDDRQRLCFSLEPGGRHFFPRRAEEPALTWTGLREGLTGDSRVQYFTLVSILVECSRRAIRQIAMLAQPCVLA
jgi:hypothetical protein